MNIFNSIGSGKSISANFGTVMLLLTIILGSANHSVFGQTVLSSAKVLGSIFDYDQSGMVYLVSGSGNKHFQYYYRNCRNCSPVDEGYVVPDFPATIYSNGASMNLDYIPTQVDSSGNKYFPFGAPDSMRLDNVIYPGGFYVVSTNANGVRWLKSGIQNVCPDNKGFAFYLSNDSIVKINGSGAVVFSAFLPGFTPISADQQGGVYISNGTEIKRLDGNGLISWTRPSSPYNFDPRGNLYLQITADSTIKIDRFNNQIWKRKRNVMGHQFDYNGNSFKCNNKDLFKYNANGAVVWKYSLGSANDVYFMRLTIDASNRLYLIFANRGDYLPIDNVYSVYNSEVHTGASVFTEYSDYAYYEVVLSQQISAPNIALMYEFAGFDYHATCDYHSYTITNFGKEFSSANVFNIYACDSSGSNCLLLASKTGGIADSILVTFPQSLPGSYLKLTSTQPALSTGLRYFTFSPIDSVKIATSYTKPLCIGEQANVYAVAYPGPFFSGFSFKLEKNGQLLTNTAPFYINSTDSGYYKIRVQNPINTCNLVTDSVLIEAAPPLSNVLTHSGQLEVCSGQTVPLQSSSISPISKWLRNNVELPGVSGANYIATSSGVYRSMATDQYGCTKLSNSRKVVVGVSSATISPLGNLAICTGDSVALSVNQSSGFSYQWRRNGVNINGANAPMLQAKSAGTYRCLFTNTAGCTKLSNSLVVSISCKEANVFQTVFASSIYPNPAQDLVELRYEGNQPERIELYNMLGEKVYDSPWRSSFTVSGLAAGLYLVRISGAGETEMLRMEVVR